MPGSAPASDKDEGSGQRGIFRGSIAQRLISLSTLRSESRLSPRKTGFRLLARLYRTGLVTRMVPIKGFTFEMTLLFRASCAMSAILWGTLLRGGPLSGISAYRRAKRVRRFAAQIADGFKDFGKLLNALERLEARLRRLPRQDKRRRRPSTRQLLFRPKLAA